MITYRRSTEAGLETVKARVEGCWIDVVDPTPDEAKRLASELGIPSDFIADSLDPDQVSLIQKDGDTLLVLVRFPHFQGSASKAPYCTLPIGFAVAGDWVATFSRAEHDLLRDLPHERERDIDTARPVQFLLVALWSVANMYLRSLAEIDKIVEGLEERLQGSLRNREVLELLRYQKCLVHFTNSLHGNELILDRLRQGEHLKLGRPVARQLDDVEIENRQAIDRVEIANDILSNMMDAFASIISNNLNVVMKLLTSLTIVLIVSTIIATFYGMNVPLPFADSRWAFPVLVGISALCSLAVALIFWKKDWL